MTRSPLALLRKAVEEAVTVEGLRAFAERTGVPLGVVRGAQRDQNLTAASIAKLAGALGLEFYVGPRQARPRLTEAAADGRSPPGLAEAPAVFRMLPPGQDAWAELDRPAPPGAFFLRRDIDPEAGDSGPYCLVQPDIGLVPEALVYLEDREGRVAIGRYLGTDPANGWIKVLRHGAAMTDERAPGSLRRIAAVTWTGWTPPAAMMAELAAAAEEVMERRRAAGQAIDEILADLRNRFMKAIE